MCSLQRQTFPSWECVCVDDGSTDSTPERLAYWAAADSRIRVFQQPNAGPGAARNRGIVESASRYFCFLDGDDALHPCALQRLFETAVSRNVDVTVGSFQSFAGPQVPSPATNESEGAVFVFEAPILPRLLTPEPFRFHVWGKLYDRARVATTRFPENYAGPEDTYYTMAVYGAAQGVAVIDSALYFYRTRLGSLSRRANRALDYIVGSHDVAMLCDQLCRQQSLARDITEQLLQTWGTNRIFTEVLETAAADSLDDQAFQAVVDAARAALGDLGRRIEHGQRLVAPQHLPTNVVGVCMRSRRLLRLLASLRKLRHSLASGK